MKRTALLAWILALAAMPALAGQKINLEMPVGSPIKAWGVASVDTRGGVDIFRLRADAALKDGTVLVVSVKLRGPQPIDGWIDVAKAPIYLGTALVGLNSKEDVSPVFPVRNLSEVRVSYRGRTILSGRF